MQTAWIVTGGLTAICIVSLVTANDLIAIGALTALAGWLGGNANGQRQAKTQD